MARQGFGESSRKRVREHVILVGDEHPELAVLALLVRLHEHASRVSGDEVRIPKRVLAHRLHHQQMSATIARRPPQGHARTSTR